MISFCLGCFYLSVLLWLDASLQHGHGIELLLPLIHTVSLWDTFTIYECLLLCLILITFLLYTLMKMCNIWRFLCRFLGSLETAAFAVEFWSDMQDVFHNWQDKAGTRETGAQLACHGQGLFTCFLVTGSCCSLMSLSFKAIYIRQGLCSPGESIYM